MKTNTTVECREKCVFIIGRLLHQVYLHRMSTTTTSAQQGKTNNTYLRMFVNSITFTVHPLGPVGDVWDRNVNERQEDASHRRLHSSDSPIVSLARLFMLIA